MKRPHSPSPALTTLLTGLSAVATFVFLTGCGTNPQSVEMGIFPSGERMAYIVNGLSETLSAIDLTDGAVYNNVLELGRWPNGISEGTGGATIYVVNSGDNQVMEIDRQTGKATRRIDVGIGRNPWECESDGMRLWVTNFLTGEVAVVDIDKGSVSDLIKVGATLQSIVLDDDAVYVTDTVYQYGSFGRGKVIKLDRGSGGEIGSVYIGTNPQDLLIDGSGHLHVLCTGSYSGGGEAEGGTVHVIDPASMVPIDTLSLGGNPSSMCETNSGIIYATGYWGGVMAYEGNDLEVINDSATPILDGDGYTDIEEDPSSGLLYILEFDQDRVIVFDESAGRVTRHIVVGDGPVRMLMSERELPENNRLPGVDQKPAARVSLRHPVKQLKKNTHIPHFKNTQL